MSLDLERIAATALQEILSSVFAESVTATAPAAIEDATADPERVAAVAGFAGPRAQGTISLNLPHAWLKRLAGTVTGGNGDDELEDSDVRDLAGELCNMLAGRITAALAGVGIASVLRTPEVRRGWAPPPGVGGQSFRSFWACAEGTLEMALQIVFTEQ